MKFKAMLAMALLIATAMIGFAQNTIHLFDAIDTAWGTPPEPPFIYAEAFSFANSSLYLACEEDSSATITGPYADGWLIVDNFITVNGTDICPKQGECFGAYTGPGTIGAPIETNFTPIGPITFGLDAGINRYDFRLMDYGGLLGNSSLDLTTSCSQVYAVCHKNNGKKGQKTIFVESLNAVNAHTTQHGDTAGPCVGS